MTIGVVRPVTPLLATPQAFATRARQLTLERIDMVTAVDANHEWHSQLPDIAGLGFGDLSIAYGATYDFGLYGVAIWTRPISANRFHRPASHMLELRRLAIPDYAPKYTATRMLGQMARQIRAQYPTICVLLSYQMVAVHKGTIYKAANWTIAHEQGRHRKWEGKRNRPKDQSTSLKTRWEYALRPCECPPPYRVPLAAG